MASHASDRSLSRGTSDSREAEQTLPRWREPSYFAAIETAAVGTLQPSRIVILQHRKVKLAALTVTNILQLTIDDVEGSSSLIGYGASNEGLATTRRAIQQDTLGWLHTDGFEQLRMTQRKLNELSADKNRKDGAG